MIDVTQISHIFGLSQSRHLSVLSSRFWQPPPGPLPSVTSFMDGPSSLSHSLGRERQSGGGKEVVGAEARHEAARDLHGGDLGQGRHGDAQALHQLHVGAAAAVQVVQDSAIAMGKRIHLIWFKGDSLRGTISKF